MSKAPAVTGKDVVRVLKKFGFTEDRQRGSHLVLINIAVNARTVVPVHSKRTLKRSLFFSILKEAHLTLDEFLEKF